MKKLIFMFVLLGHLAILAQPTDCNGDYFLSIGFDGVNGFYRIHISEVDHEVTFNPIGPGGSGFFVNSVGFRSTDNFIYGIAFGNQVARINAAGEATILATIPNLNPELHYWAGDVSPDGQYLFVLGTHETTSNTVGLARINLDNFSTQVASIPNAEEAELFIADIVFDTETEDVYAFDGHANRLIKVNPNTGSFDEAFYPPSDIADDMGAIFIDAFGDLYGYGRRIGEDVSDTFFKIDKVTGAITVEAFGPEAGGKDACSCPYSVEIQKSVIPKVALPCDEVTYVFKIANNSSITQTGLNFMDVLPNGLIITEIVRHPFDGDLTGGVGTNFLSIDNFTLPQGVDSIIIRTYVPETAGGRYKNQAIITNLSEGLGGETLSDDPTTIATEDSTLLSVPEFTAAISSLDEGLCPGDTLELQAAHFPTATYQWSNGNTKSSISVTSVGWYFVTVTSNCETISDSIYVFPTGFEIDLGPDLSIDLGDSIMLPLNHNNNPVFAWTDPFGNSLSCFNCFRPYARPYFDVSYEVAVTDEFGCTLREQINIEVSKDRKIYIPNAFSPNFDGINDIFFIQGKGFGIIRNFRIFNRWGALVYGVNDVDINATSSGWDGRFNGKLLDPGILVYFAEIEFLDGLVERFEGDFLLLR